MRARLAVMEDLPIVKETFARIVANMLQNGIDVWDETYPCDFFEDDIKSKRLYVIFDGEKLVSAFALCESLAKQKRVLLFGLNLQARPLHLIPYSTQIVQREQSHICLKAFRLLQVV